MSCGTRATVRKPTGEIVGHVFRDDCLFRANEKVAEQNVLRFARDGFLITVEAADVVEVHYQCPQCYKRVGIEGLCDECRLKWLPRSG